MAKEFNFDVYAKNLPDAYRKDVNSNNYKILETEKRTQLKLEKDITDIFDSLDIWKATGKTLDLYGEIYNLSRKTMTDDAYRVFILMKVVQMRAGSDHASIVKALSSTLGMPVESLYMTDSEKGGSIDVSLPYDVFQSAGVTPQQAIDILRNLLAVGVGVDKFNLLHEMQSSLQLATAITQGEKFIVTVE